MLLRIDEIEDIAQVRQLLRAHEYWRMKRLGVDLVIVNEHARLLRCRTFRSRSRPRYGAANRGRASAKSWRKARSTRFAPT